MEPIYLDYNATTPVDPRVAAEMRPYLDHIFGNPSSIHRFGLAAKTAVELARKQVAGLLNAHPDEVVFTSGGTEANNFAIKGAAFARRSMGNHIVTTAIEHPAVTEVCRYLEQHGFMITYVGVDEFGMVDPSEVEKAIRPGTILVSVMHANNETGTIQPVAEIGKITRPRGILFHVDAAQSAGKIPVDVEMMHADLLSVAGHKFYAPKGVGALYIRRGVTLEKLIHGADHEANLRAGTENVLEIVGLGKAAEIAGSVMEDTASLQDRQGPGQPAGQAGMRGLRDLLFEGIRREIPGVRLNGHPEMRLPNTLSLGFPGVEADLLLGALKEVAASAGAACHADQQVVSGVLAAMHVPLEYALGTVRFSLGRMTTREEIEKAIPAIVEAYRKLTGASESSEIRHPSPVIRLTEYTHSLGCACKIRPQLLERILKDLPSHDDPAVLVGFESSDDAAVYRLSDDTAIVQTVDFIPPVVDDPYFYGAIAAANALSDIYAMGATPRFALSIVGFPDRKLPLEVLQEILRGAHDKAAEAGIRIIGGHSIEDSEPKFGLAVTGLVHPGKILRNSTARAGDVLVLTKPLGTGIITTAIKRGLASPGVTARVMKLMAGLNSKAAGVMAQFPVSACTDVTGFGLLGHLKEMVASAGVRAVVNAESVPVVEEAWEYAAAGAVPGGTTNNMDFVKPWVTWSGGTPELLKLILADAQTSGGLLISLPESSAAELLKRLHAAGVTGSAIIGAITAGSPGISV
jgi:cysteine desulfurase NifS/selenium donor protein